MSSNIHNNKILPPEEFLKNLNKVESKYKKNLIKTDDILITKSISAQKVSYNYQEDLKYVKDFYKKLPYVKSRFKNGLDNNQTPIKGVTPSIKPQLKIGEFIQLTDNQNQTTTSSPVPLQRIMITYQGQPVIGQLYSNGSFKIQELK